MSGIAARRGDLTEAFEWADRAVAANPADPYSHSQLATLHLQRDDLAAAEAALGKALEIAPANASLLQRKSEIAARRGDLTEARKDDKKPRSGGLIGWLFS